MCGSMQNDLHMKESPMPLTILPYYNSKYLGKEEAL